MGGYKIALRQQLVHGGGRFDTDLGNGGGRQHGVVAHDIHPQSQSRPTGHFAPDSAKANNAKRLAC